MFAIVWFRVGLSGLVWREAVLDQIDGDVALIEVADGQFHAVRLECLPVEVREGERLLYVEWGEPQCPYVLRRGGTSSPR